MPVLPETIIPEELMRDPWVRERIAQDSAFNVHALGIEIGDLAEQVNRLRWEGDRGYADAMALIAEIKTAAVLLTVVADHAAATVRTMRAYTPAPKGRRVKGFDRQVDRDRDGRPARQPEKAGPSNPKQKGKAHATARH